MLVGAWVDILCICNELFFHKESLFAELLWFANLILILQPLPYEQDGLSFFLALKDIFVADIFHYIF